MANINLHKGQEFLTAFNIVNFYLENLGQGYGGEKQDLFSSIANV